MVGSLTKGVLCLKQYLLDQNSEGSSTVMIQTWPGRKVEFWENNQPTQVTSCYNLYGRYYMAACQRYKISFRVLKISSIENIFTSIEVNEWKIFQHEKRNFVSPSSHVMFYLWYQHQWNNKLFPFCLERLDLLCNHSNGYEMYIICRPEGPDKQGHIVVHDVSWAAQTGTLLEWYSFIYTQ